MKDGLDFNLTAVNEKRHGEGRTQPAREPPAEAPARKPEPAVRNARSSSPPPAPKPATKFALPFDPLRLADVLWRHARTCLLAGASVSAIMFTWAKFRVSPHFTAEVQIIRQETPGSFRESDAGEPFKPAQITNAVLQSLMRSGALLHRLSEASSPHMSEGRLLAGLVLKPEKGSDLVRVSFTSDNNAEEAAKIINLYAHELIEFTKELQARDASQINTYLTKEIAQVEGDIAKVNEDLLNYTKAAGLIDADKEMDAYLGQLGAYDRKYEELRLDYETLDLKIKGYEAEFHRASPIAGRLRTAQEELTQLRIKYTDANPLVIETTERIKELEKQLKNSGDVTQGPPRAGESPVAESLYLQLVQLKSQKSTLSEQMQKVNAVREDVRQKLEQLPRKNLEFARIKARRQSLDTARNVLATRQREAELYEKNAIGYCRMLAEARPEDSLSDKRLSKMLMIGGGGFAMGFVALAGCFIVMDLRDRRVRTAGDLKRVTKLPVLAALPQAIRDNLDAKRDWAFRTWTRIHPQLSSAGATVCGLLSANESESVSEIASLLAEAAAWRGSAAMVICQSPPTDKASAPLDGAVGDSLNDADRWLESGNGVVYLTIEDSWTWTPAQRAKLDAAVSLWSRHRNAVIFIELPAATRPETLLVAERLPQLVWIGASQISNGDAISQQLAIYRDAECHLSGSVLDRAPLLSPSLLNKFAGVATALAVSVPLFVHSEELAPLPSDTTAKMAALSTVTAKQGRPAASGFTLGPDDTLNIVLFSHPETERKDVRVSPDGKITYLQAQNIRAAGLTIDELRNALNKELGKFYQSPRAMITPAAFNSRKVYILGKIVKKGMVNMDRPLTLVEAVSEAGGLETGLFNQNTVELADLGRSFLMRRGERIPVNFDALFMHGDMSQNVLLEDGDYIYFPSANSNEIYVLGNVKSQGTQGLFGHSTVTSAIAQANGFTPRAFKDRVLVVRGALDKPKTFVVNMNAVLNAREKSFRLEPKDIVYIADKPWARAEELLDMALTAFFQGAISTWTTSNVPTLITKPFIPSINN